MNRKISKVDAFKEISQIKSEGFDLIINLCDGAQIENRAGVEVIEYLEYFGIPFTGPRRDFY